MLLIVVLVLVLVLVVVVVVEVCDAPEASWQEPPQPGKCRGGRWANQCRQCPPRFSNKFLMNTNCVSIFSFEKVLTETSLPMGVRGTPPSYPDVSLLNAAAKFHVRDQV